MQRKCQTDFMSTKTVTHPPVKTGGFLTPLEEVTTRVLHKWSFLKDRQPLIARYFISFSSLRAQQAVNC